MLPTPTETHPPAYKLNQKRKDSVKLGTVGRKGIHIIIAIELPYDKNIKKIMSTTSKRYLFGTSEETDHQSQKYMDWGCFCNFNVPGSSIFPRLF